MHRLAAPATRLPLTSPTFASWPVRRPWGRPVATKCPESAHQRRLRPAAAPQQPAAPYLDGEVDEDEGEWEEGDEYEEYEEEWADGEVEEEEEEDEDLPLNTAATQIPAHLESVEYTENEFVEVGIVGRAHGVRGEVKVTPSTDAPRKRFKPGRRLWLLPPRPQGMLAARGVRPTLRRLVVKSGRMLRPAAANQREVWGLSFEGITSREQISELGRQTLLLALCDREVLPPSSGEVYVQDLIGLAVVQAADGRLLGSVTEVYDGTGTYDTLRVRLLPSREDVQKSAMRTVLIPFAREIVTEVQLPQRRLLVAPPEGLLDMTTAKKLRRPYTPEQQAELLAEIDRLEAQQGPSAPLAAQPQPPPQQPRAGGKQQQQQQQQQQGSGKQPGAPSPAAQAAPGGPKPPNRAQRRAAANSGSSSSSTSEG